MAACYGLRHQGRKVPHYIMQSGSVIALLQPPPPRVVPLKIAVPPTKKILQKNGVLLSQNCSSVLCVCLSESVCVCVWQVPPPSLGHDMAQLLESGQAADVRFKVEEEELAAHKFILTARSPVFRSVAAALFILL